MLLVPAAESRPQRPKTAQPTGTQRELVDAALLQLAKLASPGLSLTNAQIDTLLAYLDLISKWTRVYNLTAVRDPMEMVTHHLLDCLAVMGPLTAHLAGSSPMKSGAPASASSLDFREVGSFGHVGHLGHARQVEHAAQGGLTGQTHRLLDVGSGAGLPGVVIAICFPEVSVTCVDTVAKKAAFIKQVALTLKLPNLVGLHARVETLGEALARPGAVPKSVPYDVVCSRAFAALADFTQWSAGALAPSGVWMAMKGKRPDDEIANLSPEVDVFHVEQLKVPSLDAERCIVWMRKRSGRDAG